MPSRGLAYLLRSGPAIAGPTPTTTQLRSDHIVGRAGPPPPLLSNQARRSLQPNLLRVLQRRHESEPTPCRLTIRRSPHSPALLHQALLAAETSLSSALSLDSGPRRHRNHHQKCKQLWGWAYDACCLKLRSLLIARMGNGQTTAPEMKVQIAELRQTIQNDHGLFVRTQSPTLDELRRMPSIAYHKLPFASSKTLPYTTSQTVGERQVERFLISAANTLAEEYWDLKPVYRWEGSDPIDWDRFPSTEGET
jgi:hypothetical protein